MYNDLVARYNTLNNSFKKKLVFRLGMEAGFFSEYNNMILAMLYCLTHQIKFVLYSEHANFGYNKGWSDYFMPFCEETKHSFHQKYNHRYPGAYFNKKERIKIRYYKLFYGFDYFTHEIWLAIRNKDNFTGKKFNIPQLGINGDVNEACKVLVQLTWTYNMETKNAIEKHIKSLGLPDKYIGIHVRKGDKDTEQDLIDTEIYAKEVKKVSDINDIFVLTDEYDVIKELRLISPELNLYTLCGEGEHGYIHSDFQKRSKEDIRNAHIKLFASIEVLSNAEVFIGTFSSNPGMYLGMRMPAQKCIGLDSEKWEIW